MGLRLLWQPVIAVIVTHDDCVVVFLANKFSLSLSLSLSLSFSFRHMIIPIKRRPNCAVNVPLYIPRYSTGL